MAERKDYLKRVTVENRILLLLFDHRGKKDDYSVPEVLSQGGMSKEMDIRQNNISRSLQELMSKGLVVSRSSHVSGKQRRRKTYHLTDKGCSYVEGLIDSLSGKIVLVRTKSESLEEWTLERLISHLSRQMSRKFSVYETITDHLDGNEADLTLCGLAGRGMPRYTPSLPVVEEFYGREEEMSVLDDLMDMDGPGMMLVLGIAGQGKTTLVSQFLKDRFITRFHWVPCNRWMRPLNFLMEYASTSRARGSDRLSSYLKGSPMVNLRSAILVLLEDLSVSGTLLIVDDAHRMNEEMSDLMRLMKEELFSLDFKAKIMVMSRERPMFYSRTEIMMKDRMMELELTGLDRGSVGSLLRDIDIPDEEHDLIFKLTNGHPLALALLKASPDLDPTDLRSSLDRFLDEEILSSLGREERFVLEMGSVLDDPVKMDCFTSLENVEPEHVNSLRKRMLLRDYSNGTMDLHDAVKDTVLSSLSPKMKVRYQKKALDYYSKRSSDTDLLNHLRLCRELGMVDETVSILTDYGEYLLGKGYPLVLDTLGEIMEADLERSTRVRMLILVSEANRLNGDNDASMEALREAALLCEGLYQSDETEGMVLMSRILSRFAEAHLLQGVSREGMRTYKKSLNLVRKAGVPQEEGKVLSNMGTAYMGLEEFDLALNHLERALHIFRDLGDHREALICRLNIGEVHERKGDLASALKFYLKIIKETSNLGLDRIEYQAMYRTGRLYMMVMQPGDAYGYLRSSLSGFFAMGDVEYAERILVQFLSSSIKSDKKVDGLRTLKRFRRSLVRSDRIRSRILGRKRMEGADTLMSWLSIFIPVLEDDKVDYHGLVSMLNRLKKEKAQEMLTEISYALSSDFKGPDRPVLNGLIKVDGLNERLKLEAHVLLASTFHEASHEWKRHIRKAMGWAREGNMKEQRERLRSMLARATDRS
ncbi:MAG: tetratricopeptide repeat protein [Thermoplasmatota archaeon]